MEQTADRARGRAGEVFAAFAKLGCTAFGGPIAHIGYFRDDLVLRRGWIDEAGYGELVALCQFLPGPTSSQVGFALGLRRAGPLGALAAFTAFTAPSAALMVAFAYGSAWLGGPAGLAAIHGLKLAACAIVAQAVLGMTRTLASDRIRAIIVLAALTLTILVGGAPGQLGAIAIGALAGALFCRTAPASLAGQGPSLGVSRRAGAACLILFTVLLLGLPMLRAVTGAHAVALIDALYRCGALVFGGGHVALPLMRAEVVPPGWIGQDRFLAGYGAAQAIPGPLFTFAAYLGAAMGPQPHGLIGAALALLAVFLPGFLILVGVLPFWQALRARPPAQAAMRGAGAAVVGVLAAALYDPIWTSAVLGPRDFLLAAAGLVALTGLRAPPIAVVAGLVVGALAVA